MKHTYAIGASWAIELPTVDMSTPRSREAHNLLLALGKEGQNTLPRVSVHAFFPRRSCTKSETYRTDR